MGKQLGGTDSQGTSHSSAIRNVIFRQVLGSSFQVIHIYCASGGDECWCAVSIGRQSQIEVVTAKHLLLLKGVVVRADNTLSCSSKCQGFFKLAIGCINTLSHQIGAGVSHCRGPKGILLQVNAFESNPQTVHLIVSTQFSVVVLTKERQNTA